MASKAFENYYEPINEKSLEAHDQLSRHVNTGLDNKEFLRAFVREHRTTQQAMIKLFLTVIEEVGSDEYVGHTDARNVQAHEVCKKLLAGFKSQVPENQNDFKPADWLGYI